MYESWIWTCPRKDFDGGDLLTGQKLGFYGDNFADPLEMNTYQRATHFSDDGTTTDICTVHCNNVMYIDDKHCSLNNEPKITLDKLKKEDATLKLILHGLGKIRTYNTFFYAYNGLDRSIAPDGVTSQCAEIGNQEWTEAAGSELPLILKEQNGNTLHEWFIAVSASPTKSSIKSKFSFAIETEYETENGTKGKLKMDISGNEKTNEDE